MISEEQLAQAAREYEDTLLAGLPEPEPHSFSPRFLRRMEPVLTRAKQGNGFMLQRVACAVLAVLFFGGILISVPEAKATMEGWFKGIYNGWISYFIPETQTPETALPEYELSWIPDGYSLYQVQELPNGKTCLYTDADGRILSFKYLYRAGEASVSLYFYDAEHLETILNGQTADIYLERDPENSNAIVFKSEDGTILYIIDGYFDQDTLMKLAENIIKKVSE